VRAGEHEEGGGQAGQFWGIEAKSSGKTAELSARSSMSASAAVVSRSGVTQGAPDRYAQLASSLLAPLRFAGRSESNNADEAVPQLR